VRACTGAGGRPRHPSRVRACLRTLAAVPLAFLLLTAGCAVKRPVTIWRFTHCAHNGTAMVCECSSFHTLLDAKTGAEVRVCD
jgi:hypothetical protein